MTFILYFFSSIFIIGWIIILGELGQDAFKWFKARKPAKPIVVKMNKKSVLHDTSFLDSELIDA